MLQPYRSSQLESHLISASPRIQIAKLCVLAQEMSNAKPKAKPKTTLC